MKTKLQIIIPLLLFTISAYSQDIIFKKDGTTVWTNVLQYSKNIIVYKLYDNPESAVQLLSAEQVAKVVYDPEEKNSDSLEYAVYLKTLPLKDTVQNITMSFTHAEAESTAVAQDTDNTSSVPLSPKKRRIRHIIHIAIAVAIVGILFIPALISVHSESLQGMGGNVNLGLGDI